MMIWMLIKMQITLLLNMNNNQLQNKNKLHYNNNNNHYGCINYFSSSLASAMNWIRFYPSSGTIDEGKFIVYGVNE